LEAISCPDKCVRIDKNRGFSLKKTNRKTIIAGLVIAVALIVLLIATTRSSTQYFLTVSELQSGETDMTGRNVRMSGVVLGDTIVYDPQTLELVFEVAQIPGDHRVINDMGGMAAVLEKAAADPTLPRITIHYNGVKPDLLKHEAQAIVSGSLDVNGIFQAKELLLKCPSKYESALQNQAGN
jgi:cytochrome c-type biogenesis protein CcmE